MSFICREEKRGRKKRPGFLALDALLVEEYGTRNPLGFAAQKHSTERERAYEERGARFQLLTSLSSERIAGG